MRLTTCMLWYAEPLDELWEQVTALKGFSDRLVAVNGRWSDVEGHEFPTPERDTSREEIATIIEAAETAGIDVTVHRPAGTWAGEVAQRNYTLALALTSDWIFLMDADERVVRVGETVRDELGSMTEDVGTIDFFTLAKGSRQPVTTWEHAGELTEQRRLFRVVPGLRYEKHHWWLRSNRWALWGEMPGLRLAKAHKLDVRVEHRTCLRDQQRWAMKDEFRVVRDPADLARGFEW